MSYLLYSSDEMFSSTELIRKSKSIFDKVSNHDIDKAIILRDGKPTFILFDFQEYEKIMKEYLDLKSTFDELHVVKQTNIQTTIQTSIQKEEILEEEEIEKQNDDKVKNLDDFVVTLDVPSDEENNAQIKEFWNK